MGNQVWRALAGPSGLSRTMDRRGGIGQAHLRAADANLDMKRMEHGLGRDKKLMDMRVAEHETKMPGLELQKSKDEDQMSLGPIPRDEHMPTNSVTGTVQYFAEDKKGVSNHGVSERAIPGSTWVRGEDGREYRADKDGKVLQLPKWKRDKIRQDSMFFTILRTDPKHFLADQILEMQMKQERIGDTEGSPGEHANYQQKIDKIQGVLDDPKQMLALYERQLTAGVKGLGSLIAQGSNPQYIAFAQSEIKRTRGKIDSLTTTKEEAKRLKVLDKQMALIDKQTAALSRGNKKALTEYQGVQTRARARDIVNKRIEAQAMQPWWMNMSQDEQAKWYDAEVAKEEKALMPSSITGSGGRGAQDGLVSSHRPSGGAPAAGETRMGLEGTKYAGKLLTFDGKKWHLPAGEQKGDDTTRTDGTDKGNGWLGPIKMTDGSNKVMTEMSIGVNIDGKETLIPAIVPTLTKSEIDHLAKGGEPTKAIIDKAVEHARAQIEQGKSPFKDDVMMKSLKGSRGGLEQMGGISTEEVPDVNLGDVARGVGRGLKRKTDVAMERAGRNLWR